MNRYPGNHMDSGIVTLPRQLKTRPGAPQTHLAYITGDEARMLQEHKPGTPHEGAAGIPNYDTWGIDTSGNVTGGSTSGGGGSWSGDPGGNQDPPPTMWSGPNNPNYNSGWGNDPAGEFGTVPEEAITTYEPWVSSTSNLPDEYVYEGDYVPWQTSSSDNFISALGGLDYNWVDPDSDFFLDPYGDQIGSPGYGLWNPFIAGYDPETGEPIYLTTSQFNEIMTFGEAGSPWETEVQTGGNNPGGSGWGGNWGGSNLNYGNRSGYGKYADWGNRPFMKQSFDSPMPQYYASLKNPGQPTNIAKFNNMMGNMYNSGIRSLG